MWSALAVLAALAIGAWASYPRILERREHKRRALASDGIVLGAGPIDLQRKNAPGALLLHGGGDTPQVLAGLAEYLHKRGFSVKAPLLSGHGRSISDFAVITSEHWQRDAEMEFSAMRATHDWVGVVGLSMGGALAVTLASNRRDVDALVLLAPYIAMPVALRGLAATTALWGWLFPYFSSWGGRSIHDPAAAARALGRGLFTPASFRALYEVVIRAELSLPLVKTPTLVMQSREDNRISQVSAEAAYALLGSEDKKIVWTQGAGHVITVDYGYERVFEQTADWLESHARVSP